MKQKQIIDGFLVQLDPDERANVRRATDVLVATVVAAAVATANRADCICHP